VNILKLALSRGMIYNNFNGKIDNLIGVKTS